MKKAVKIIISGTVQGMFFKNFIKENADTLKIKGLIRSLETGDIEIIAEGNQEEIQKFIEVCKNGPKFARIKSLATEERNFSGDFPDFRVLRF